MFLVITEDDINSTNEQPFMNHLEWEGLQEKYIMGDYNEINSESLPPGSKKIEIFRNKDYKIKGKLTGDFKRLDDMNILNGKLDPKNKFIPFKHFKILDIDAEYEIKCSFKNTRCTHNIIEGRSFSSDMNISYLKRDFTKSEFREMSKKPKLSWFTEWFLNGPRNLQYGGSIRYSLCKKYIKQMELPTYPAIRFNHKLYKDFLNKENYNLKQKYYKRGSKLKGYLFVEFEDNDGNDKYFTIQSVPDHIGPPWSKKISIEYKIDWWMPTIEERQKINEIVSFLMGRQLISIGYAKYDENGMLFEDCSYNPNISDGIHLQDLCKANDIPPVDTIKDQLELTKNNIHKYNISVYLKKLIPNYFALRDKLNLHDVLDKYWLSQAIPKESEIIILAACLESLIKSWFKSNKTKSKGVYISKKEFDNNLKRGLNLIKIELGEIEDLNQEFKDKIFKTIENSFQMAPGQRNKNFFKEIGLNIGIVEKEAIIYRNKPVHGDILVQNTTTEIDEFAKMIRMTNAYRTLVNRAILKILDYDNNYVDYYHSSYHLTEGIRRIDDPIPPQDTLIL